MTDKVQKIREEVERLQKELIQEKEKGFGPDIDDACILELQNVLTYIDSLKEEPKFKTGDRIKPVDSCLGAPRTILEVCDGWYVTNQGTLDFEFEDNWEAVEEPVNEDLEEASKNYALNNTPWDDCKDEIQEAFKAGAKWQKEKNSILPMDLGEYINELSKQFPEVSFAKLSRIAVRVAKWQKEQFEKNRLKHCDSITNEQAELEQGFIDQHLDKHQRMPTFLDAIEYGMRLQRENMMKDATDVTVHIEAGNYPYIPQMELYDYDKDIPLAKEGDKYKVVLIKEK